MWDTTPTPGRNKVLHLMHKLYEQCKEKQLEFEIVVLYLPLNSGIDPNLFMEKKDELFQRRNICGWWCLPFNNSVSLRFQAFTKHYDYENQLGFDGYGADHEDKLIIVGPNGKILDMYGAVVARNHGDVFPFTRAAVAEKEIRELRLGSLLVGQLFRGDDPSDVIFGSTLQSSKKKIVVYMGNIVDENEDEFAFDVQRLASEYKKMKKSGDDEFEEVFIEFSSGGVTSDTEFAGMPWYVYWHLDGTCTSLAKELKKVVGLPSLVGFGEDGRVCSVKPTWNFYRRDHKDMDGGDTRALCWDDTLYQDIYRLHAFHRRSVYGDI